MSLASYFSATVIMRQGFRPDLRISTGSTSSMVSLAPRPLSSLSYESSSPSSSIYSEYDFPALDFSSMWAICDEYRAAFADSPTLERRASLDNGPPTPPPKEKYSPMSPAFNPSPTEHWKSPSFSPSRRAPKPCSVCNCSILPDDPYLSRYIASQKNYRFEVSSTRRNSVPQPQSWKSPKMSPVTGKLDIEFKSPSTSPRKAATQSKHGHLIKGYKKPLQSTIPEEPSSDQDIVMLSNGQLGKGAVRIIRKNTAVNYTFI
ncbi:hypothetical protein NEOLI_004489 [Neolecta irregularis DAH-3]|uniref:Uncharacterized protein n=1 Tax=Neolecta irregularis (strain DAH-3) TaxID=1198029 RepID=A0A1U7LLQ0_NEOID|nr:hypothetical protein NEOLI_004489 [Neolecta irregularis DAH-3]|eukprot:OLL23577.1 hypothetical protein NEOLI_004489 [Neolecta irregularis DAH-3]